MLTWALNASASLCACASGPNAQQPNSMKLWADLYREHGAAHHESHAFFPSF